MSKSLHYEDAKWRDVPKLLCLLVHEVQSMNSKAAADVVARGVNASVAGGRRDRAYR